ncbi:hypothetical protein BX666DRAFT_1985004 [Dichotomocladium elegans]|nr:hypothetical protein BX666DRAFT_1985004 [Dichotomocladium elegans]
MSDEESTKKTSTAVSTLFVGKLPRDANSRELEEFFSEIGPIRNCFVVADRTDGKIEESDPKFRNKGIGYVHFSVAEDAHQALEKLKGAKFKGQTIKMELAKRKSSDKRTRQKASDLPGENIADNEDGSSSRSKKRQRTDTNRAARLIVRNLPWKYAEKDLERIFGKHGQVDEVTLPRKFPGGPLRGFGFVQFREVEDAEKVSAVKEEVFTDWCSFNKSVMFFLLAGDGRTERIYAPWTPHCSRLVALKGSI